MHAHKSISRETDHHPILSCSFNQNQDCFAISHDHGFRVYSTDHMEMRVDRKIEGGGIGIAQMLHRTNYLALVGGGRNPKYSQNKVVIWDDLKRRPALSLEFLSSILNVQLSRTRIVVVLQNKVHIYAFSSPPTRIAAYETTDNPHGIVAMAENVVAFPSRTPGQVQIVSLTDEHLVSIVRAHKSPIRCLALSPDGSILASASDAGTIIRLFSTTNTAPITEFRRGLDKAVIYSMAFSQQSNRLAVLSDKNTLHVYDAAPGPEPFNTNRKHILSKFPLLPTYFSGKWSFVSARVNGTRGVVGWAAEDSVVVIWTSDECRWEKWVIVDRDPPPGSDGVSSPEPQFELVREAWRGFEGFDE